MYTQARQVDLTAKRYGEIFFLHSGFTHCYPHHLILNSLIDPKW
jgi:hypothetical protein